MNLSDLKKKVAIVFTGRLITDPAQYQHFQTFFKTPLEALDCQIDLLVCHSKGYSPEHIQTFVNLYQPMSIHESDEVIDVDYLSFRKRPETQPRNVMCMYLNRRNAGRLLADRNYDLVISLRNDLWFKTPIPFQQFFTHFTETRGIYIPQGHDWGGINDQCAFGTFDEMKTYFALYDEVVSLLTCGTVLHPETLLKVYLDQKQVPVYRCAVTHDIKRYT